MQIPFINGLSGAEILKAICWTLVHSLWQGLLLAIAGGLVIMFTKKRHPSIRYNLLAVFFLAFILTSFYTFVVELQQPSALAQDITATVTGNLELQTTPAQANSFTSAINNFASSFTYYFDKNAPLVVLIWFIILSARLIKMFSGLLYINRIRNQKISSPDQHWQNRLLQLQSILQIHKRVQLLESGIIKVPMAVGWLKPAILIPAGLFTHLSGEQLEAILLHELAHIKRKDYFVNLLQSLAETIFFFNPAVLWLSSLIREERENCCDDMAISITKNKTKFINALVSFQEYNSAEYAMPFAGKKNHLLNRVQRIIYNTNNTLNAIERAGIASCCLAMVILSAFVTPQNGQHALIKDLFELESMASDSTTEEATGEHEKATQPESQNVSKAKNSNTKSNISASRNVRTKTGETKAIVAPEQDHVTVEKKDTTPVTNYNMNIDNVNINTNINLDVRSLVKLANIVKLDSMVALKKVLMKMSPVEIKLPNFSLNMNYNIDSSNYRLQFQDTSKKINPRPKINPQPAPNPQQRVSPQQRVNPLPKSNPQAKPNPLADPVIVSMIKEKLVDEAVIKNYENFYYILNNRELVVQGIKQTEAVFKKFKDKFINPTGQTTRSYIWMN